MKTLPISSINPRYFPNLLEAEVFAIFNTNSTFALIPQEATPGEDGERRFTVDVRRQTNNEWEGFIASPDTIGTAQDADTGRLVDVRRGPGGLLVS